MKPAVVVSTFPDRASISRVADQLVRDGVVACVNFGRVSSVYSWKGKVENADEYLAIFKTTQKNKGILKKALADLHPYDVPEIAEVYIDSINESYMKWIIDSTC